MRDRLLQLACVAVLVLGAVANGGMLPRLLEIARVEGIRYTSDPIEGAPPIVAIGTAIGALRGLIANYLWIKLQQQKDQGQFYEAMADADLITKMQPRFAEVWGFHGHNMAYNISVLTNTPQERWAWVNAGIDLVRNRGLRYNPNDLGLNKDLGFWFSHKIDGVSDDAHLYYKRELAKEWHFLLGAPPKDQAEREKALRQIADAPDSREELERLHPEVLELERRLTEGLSPFDRRFAFRLDRDFLMNVGKWLAVRSSPYARLLGMQRTFAANDPVYATFDKVLGDPKMEPARRELLAFLRKKVLRDDYIRDSNGGVERWNRVMEKAGIPFRLTVPHKAFHRNIGALAGTKVSPDGRVISDAEWNAQVDQWLPTGEDRAYVASLMGRVVEPGKFANWIAPPVMGINRQPVDFEYVRFN